MEKKLKLKNRDKTFSSHFSHLGEKGGFNFMLDNAAMKERLTTKPGNES